MLKALVLKSRSYRRFYQEVKIERAVLEELVDLARLTPSAANKQPLKYYLACTPKINAEIFSTLAWAGYLPDWPGPVEGERPGAYIIMLGDKKIATSFQVDSGIAAQTIMLGAAEKGLGGCIIASVQRERLLGILDFPDQYEIVLVLALGKPRENVILDTVGPAGDVKYWRAPDQTHHVPKRALKDIIVNPEKV